MLDQSYRLNAPNCISEAVEDDLIVINLGTGRYYNMRGSSVLAWHALMDGHAPVALIQANQWDADHLTAFEQFIAQLVSENLIVAAPTSSHENLAPIIAVQSSEDGFRLDIFTDMEEILGLDPIHEADNQGTGWPKRPD